MTKEEIAGLIDKMPQDMDVNDFIHELVNRALSVKRKWVGLNSFDRTFLRTTYAPLKPLHHIKETETDIVAEVVNDWEAFFTAIEEVLKERNT
jgi:hypothetical protein